MDERRPRISIGLPVFNGERYLVQAIESILEQTYAGYELIICDNASTDGTRRICEAYAARDPRIRYIRHERNLGAAANFNRCVELASGEYFKWAAHDDLLAPSFLEKAVTALDANPDAVLCQSVTEMIDADGHGLGTYDPGRLPTGSARPSERFWGRLREAWCKEVFGLIRADALSRTSLIGSFGDADRALIAELALIGRFVILNEPLFMNREHAERYTRRVINNPEENLGWYSRERPRRVMQRWKLYGSFIGAVRRHCSSPTERLRCYAQLVRSLAVNWNFVLLAIDPIVAVEPRFFVVLLRTKRRLLGYKKWSNLFEKAAGSER